MRILLERMNSNFNFLTPFCFHPVFPGSVFQFGSNTSNFNFPNNPGVFTFGANLPAPAAPAQPSGSSGFSFSQPPAFTVG